MLLVQRLTGMVMQLLQREWRPHWGILIVSYFQCLAHTVVYFHKVIKLGLNVSIDSNQLVHVLLQSIPLLPQNAVLFSEMHILILEIKQALINGPRLLFSPPQLLPQLLQSRLVLIFSGLLHLQYLL